MSKRHKLTKEEKRRGGLSNSTKRHKLTKEENRRGGAVTAERAFQKYLTTLEKCFECFSYISNNDAGLSSDDEDALN